MEAAEISCFVTLSVSDTADIYRHCSVEEKLCLLVLCLGWLNEPFS